MVIFDVGEFMMGMVEGLDLDVFDEEVNYLCWINCMIVLVLMEVIKV